MFRLKALQELAGNCGISEIDGWQRTLELELRCFKSGISRLRGVQELRPTKLVVLMATENQGFAWLLCSVLLVSINGQGRFRQLSPCRGAGYSFSRVFRPSSEAVRFT